MSKPSERLREIANHTVIGSDPKATTMAIYEVGSAICEVLEELVEEIKNAKGNED